MYLPHKENGLELTYQWWSEDPLQIKTLLGDLGLKCAVRKHSPRLTWTNQRPGSHWCTANVSPGLTCELRLHGLAHFASKSWTYRHSLQVSPGLRLRTAQVSPGLLLCRSQMQSAPNFPWTVPGFPSSVNKFDNSGSFNQLMCLSRQEVFDRLGRIISISLSFSFVSIIYSLRSLLQHHGHY